MSHNIVPYIGNTQLSVVSNLMLNATNRFLIETRRDKALSTYKTYASKIKVFERWIEGFSMTKDMREDLKAFRAWLTDKYSSAHTINLTLSVVRQFYRSLHERGIIEYDPTVVLKNESTGDEADRGSISREDFYGISSMLKQATGVNADRNRAMFILLCMNGLRVNELANACIEDIKSNGGRNVLYLLRKGEKEKKRYVVLQDKTYDLLMDYMGGRTGAIFTSSRTGEAMTSGEISRIVKTLLKKYGIDSENITAHSLRHSYAIFALDGGADLLSLSLSMNHKNLSTTQRYLKSYNRLRNSAEDAVNLDF